MTNQHFSKELDHHGIIATVCDEIGLVDLIDCIIPRDKQADMTYGEATKLMIINGTGFNSRALYLAAQFFDNKPLKRLLGREIDADRVTDDTLGRALDALYEAGCNQIFATIALNATKHFRVSRRIYHGDSSSFHVDGEYNREDNIGLVQFGHSKDHRPDLKQFMTHLIVSNDGGVPLFAEVIPGNTSDQTHFREVLKHLKEAIDPNEPAYYVADSALYTEETIQETSHMLWVTRVPERIKSAKEVVRNVPLEAMTPMGDGYYVSELGSWYGGVKQRWLLIFSEQAMARERETLQRNIAKTYELERKALKKVIAQPYGCSKDAERALSAFSKKLKYHQLVGVEVSEQHMKEGRGRPKKGEPVNLQYKIAASLEIDPTKVEAVLSEKGKFIIATNQLDTQELSSLDLLQTYKDQQHVERGFKFLKDPAFMTSSIFLKKESRIVAMGMIMCLSLLVYTLAQRLLRQKLASLDLTIPNQHGKRTQRPTMRWIFQMFEGIQVLYVRGSSSEIILNLNDVRETVLSAMGPAYQARYRNVA